jgi:hypothetical protein
MAASGHGEIDVCGHLHRTCLDVAVEQPPAIPLARPGSLNTRSLVACSSYPRSVPWTASVIQWSEFLATERRCIVLPVRYELNLYMLCTRK